MWFNIDVKIKHAFTYHEICNSKKYFIKPNNNVDTIQKISTKEHWNQNQLKVKQHILQSIIKLT